MGRERETGLQAMRGMGLEGDRRRPQPHEPRVDAGPDVLPPPRTARNIRHRARDGQPLTAAGQVFRMAMYNDNVPGGHYRMANRVQVFDPPRAISWEPGMDTGDGSPRRLDSSISTFSRNAMKVRADSSRSMSCLACCAIRCRSTVRACTRRPHAASSPGGHGPAAWAAAMTRL